MGVGNLSTRSAGDTIVADFFNSIQSAMDGDFVGRSSGAAAAGQNLGTAAFPWGTARVTSLIVNGSTIDTALSTAPQNRVVSGKTRTTSNQPAYLLPTASLAFQVLGSATNLVLDANGVTVSVTTDITKTGITAGPSADNTATLNDASAAGGAITRIWGEHEVRKELTVASMGSNMQNKVGQWVAVKLAGAATEYALGYLESSVKISRLMRGFFVNASGSPINRTTISHTNVITILSLAWIFMDDDGTTVDVTYNNPVWAYSSPSSPVTGDYWYDLANQTWKRYDGASFQIIGRTFIGWACADTTAVVGVRGLDFYARPDNLNTIKLEINTTEIIRARYPQAKLNVMGTIIDFGQQLPTWNITTNLATSVDMYSSTEQASRLYYLYIAKTGQTFISDIEPFWRPDQLGWYHPHNTWRCVGVAYNNASSNLTLVQEWENGVCDLRFDTPNGYGAVNTNIRRFSQLSRTNGLGLLQEQSANSGDNYLCVIPDTYHFAAIDQNNGGTMNFGISHNSSQLTTGAESITNTDLIALKLDNGVTSTYSECYGSRYLKRGDVVRQHGANGDTTSGYAAFIATNKGPQK